MSNPDPQPSTTPGLEPGGGVAPGDTPPAEESTPGAAHNEDLPPKRSLPVGWLVAIVLAALVVGGMLLAMAVARVVEF